MSDNYEEFLKDFVSATQDAIEAVGLRLSVVEALNYYLLTQTPDLTKTIANLKACADAGYCNLLYQPLSDEKIAILGKLFATQISQLEALQKLKADNQKCQG